MRLHRFFINPNSAFQSAKSRFGGARQEGFSASNRAVSQNSGQNGADSDQSRATLGAVSHPPLYSRGEVISIPSEALIHQITNVFRLNKEDVVILTDGNDFDYVARIVSIASTGITFQIDDVAFRPFSPRLEVSLYVGLPKGDIFEWIVEKATELGVTRIVPVAAERSIKKDIRLERLEKISIEASEQSGRTVAAVIEKVIDIKEACRECGKSEGEVAGFTQVIVLNPLAHETLRDVVRTIQVDTVIAESEIKGRAPATPHDAGRATIPRVALFVGPEGGWSPAELALFSDAGFIQVKLGQTILRTETACCAGLSMLLA